MFSEAFKKHFSCNSYPANFYAFNLNTQDILPSPSINISRTEIPNTSLCYEE